MWKSGYSFPFIKLSHPAILFRQLIAGYPEHIANPSLLKQVKTREEVDTLENKICEAIPIVDQYCSRLKAELKDRHNLQYQMMDYAKALEKANERNKELVDSVRKRIARLDAEKNEVCEKMENFLGSGQKSVAEKVSQRQFLPHSPASK